jgi:site-specific recombinase XerD
MPLDAARITHENPATVVVDHVAPLVTLVLPWLTALREADQAPRTVLRYGSAVRRFLAWYATVEQRPCAPLDLTPIALVGYRTALQRTAATSTVNTHLCALRAWCAWLETTGALAANPAARLKLVKRAPADAPPALTDNAVNALLRAAQRSRHPARDYAMVQLLLQTGLRLGECQALTWGDLVVGEKSGTVLIRAGKGNKARTVPLNGSARAALASYAAPWLDVAPTVRAVAAVWPQRGQPLAGRALWRSQKQQPLSASAMWRAIHALVQDGATRQLIPPTTTPHTLRHTFARRYLDAHAGDLVGLARLLGHTDLNTTGLYTQHSAAALAERLERLPLNAYA